jgi:hypothetical protein
VLAVIGATSAISASARSQTYSGLSTGVAIAPSGLVIGDNFGDAVSAQGNLLMIGEPSADDVGVDAGAAYCFAYNAGTGSFVQFQKLTAPDAAPSNTFGSKVLLAGSTALVVSSYVFSDRSWIYVFGYEGGAFVFKQRIDRPETGPSDKFASSLALVQDRLIVGTTYRPGFNNDEVFVYQLDTATGLYALIQRIKRDQVNFGAAVAAEGDLLLVGEPFGRPANIDSGRVYLFRWDANLRQYGFSQYLVPPTAEQGEFDYFGATIALHGDLALIGAPGHDPVVDGSGAAYLYRRDHVTGSFTFAQKFTALNPTIYDGFGSQVVIDGDVLATADQVYIPDPSSGSFVLERRLVFPTGAPAGGVMAISSSLLAFGLPGDSTFAPSAGIVYGFPRSTATVPVPAVPASSAVNALLLAVLLGLAGWRSARVRADARPTISNRRRWIRRTVIAP